MTSIDPTEVERCLEGLRRGEVWAMESLVRTWQGPLYGYLMKFVGNAHTAEDLFQEVFLRVHQSRDSLPQAAGFSPWLYRVAHNLAVDSLRHSRWEKADAETVARTAAPGPTPSDDGSNRLLASAILGLPEVQRSVVCLRLYGGFTFAQIARIVDAPLNTVLGRMHLATRALRKTMAPGDVHGL